MSIWPGERNPGRYDVQDANELPDATFLQLFKTALLASGPAIDSSQGYARSTRPLLQSTTRQHVSTSDQTHEGDSRGLTYPAALLEHCPRTPLGREREALRTAFFEGLRNHVFLASASIPGSFDELIPPYLDLAFACLASTCLRSSSEPNSTGVEGATTRPADLFVAATRLWDVMLELDNREARRIEAVVAIALLSTYGVMSADATIWRSTSIHLGYMEPIVRRLGLHDVHRRQRQPKRVTTGAAENADPLMMYIFLLDMVRGLHFNTTTLFTSSEIVLSMPDTKSQFDTVYLELMAEAPEVPEGLSQLDGLFLLVALTADLIFIKESLQGVLLEADALSMSPFVPFSPTAEQRRMSTQISKSLDCWGTAFAKRVDKHTLALYDFCRLLHAFPQVCDLPKLAGYAPTGSASMTVSDYSAAVVPSDTAVDCAWQVLEDASWHPAQSDHEPIWLPIVTFLAALTIWGKFKSGESQAKSFLGSLKVLSLFQSEINRMKWPCCEEMSRTLNRLMEISEAR